jgi:hypothetical protein
MSDIIQAPDIKKISNSAQITEVLSNTQIPKTLNNTEVKVNELNSYVFEEYFSNGNLKKDIT